MGYLVDDAFSRGCGVVLNRGLFIRDNGVFSRGHGAYLVEGVFSRGHDVYLADDVGLYLIEGVFMRGCGDVFSRACI